jgi:hypothetical protein
MSCWPLKSSEPRSRSAAFPVGAPGIVAGHSAAAEPPTAKANRVTITRIRHPRATDRIAATTTALSITVAKDSVEAEASRASITTNVVKQIAQTKSVAASAAAKQRGRFATGLRAPASTILVDDLLAFAARPCCFANSITAAWSAASIEAALVGFMAFRVRRDQSGRPDPPEVIADARSSRGRGS